MEHDPTIGDLMRVLQMRRAELLYCLRELESEGAVGHQGASRHGTSRRVYLSNVVEIECEE